MCSPDLQLRGLQMPADHGRVGADRLHEGLPHPLQGGFVLRLPPQSASPRWAPAGVSTSARPGKNRAQLPRIRSLTTSSRAVLPVGRQVVQRPVLEQGKQFLLRGPAEGRGPGPGAGGYSRSAARSGSYPADSTPSPCAPGPHGGIPAAPYSPHSPQTPAPVTPASAARQSRGSFLGCGPVSVRSGSRMPIASPPFSPVVSAARAVFIPASPSEHR